MLIVVYRRFIPQYERSFIVSRVQKKTQSGAYSRPSECHLTIELQVERKTRCHRKSILAFDCDSLPIFFSQRFFFLSSCLFALASTRAKSEVYFSCASLSPKAFSESLSCLWRGFECRRPDDRFFGVLSHVLCFTMFSACQKALWPHLKPPWQ